MSGINPNSSWTPNPPVGGTQWNPDLTKLGNMINPEILTDMLAARMPKAIRFTGIAPLDFTISGRAGDTVVLPKFIFIGAAEDVPEGHPIPIRPMETSEQRHTVKKAGIGIEKSDENILNSHGQVVNEAVRQISLSIAQKVDDDILTAAQSTTLRGSHAINIDMIDYIEENFEGHPDAIEDEVVGVTGVIFMNPSDLRTIRKEAALSWTRASDLGDAILTSGVVGELLNWQFVPSMKLAPGEVMAVKQGALRTYVNRGALIETYRVPTHKVSGFNGDMHYVVGLIDESRCMFIQGSTGAETMKAKTKKNS